VIASTAALVPLRIAPVVALVFVFLKTSGP
jgi:hypothetical protein